MLDTLHRTWRGVLAVLLVALGCTACTRQPGPMNPFETEVEDPVRRVTVRSEALPAEVMSPEVRLVGSTVGLIPPSRSVDALRGVRGGGPLGSSCLAMSRFGSGFRHIG